MVLGLGWMSLWPEMCTHEAHSGYGDDLLFNQALGQARQQAKELKLLLRGERIQRNMDGAVKAFKPFHRLLPGLGQLEHLHPPVLLPLAALKQPFALQAGHRIADGGGAEVKLLGQGSYPARFNRVLAKVQQNLGLGGRKTKLGHRLPDQDPLRLRKALEEDGQFKVHKKARKEKR